MNTHDTPADAAAAAADAREHYDATTITIKTRRADDDCSLTITMEDGTTPIEIMEMFVGGLKSYLESLPTEIAALAMIMFMDAWNDDDGDDSDDDDTE